MHFTAKLLCVVSLLTCSSAFATNWKIHKSGLKYRVTEAQQGKPGKINIRVNQRSVRPAMAGLLKAATKVAGQLKKGTASTLKAYSVFGALQDVVHSGFNEQGIFRKLTSTEQRHSKKAIQRISDLLPGKLSGKQAGAIAVAISKKGGHAGAVAALSATQKGEQRTQAFDILALSAQKLFKAKVPLIVAGLKRSPSTARTLSAQSSLLLMADQLGVKHVQLDSSAVHTRNVTYRQRIESLSKWQDSLGGGVSRSMLKGIIK